MSITKKFGVSFLIKIISYLIGPLSFIFVVKPLSVEDYGLYSLINTIINFSLIIIGLGIHRFNFKEIPGKKIKDKYEILKSTLIIQLAVGCLISIIFIFLLPFFLGELYSNIIYILIPLILISSIDQEIIRFLGLIKLISLKVIYSFVQKKLWLIPIMILYFYQNISLSTIYFSKLLSSLVALFFCFITLNKKALKKAEVNPITMKKSFTFGINIILIDLGMYLLEMGDRFILEIFSSTQMLGYYSFAYKWVRIVYSLGTVFMYIMQPYIAEAYNKEKVDNRFKAVTRYINMSLKYTFVILISGLIYFSVNYSELVSFLAKAEYLKSFNIMLILSLFPIFMSVSYFFQNILVLQSRNKAITKFYLHASLINLVINFLLVPLYNGIGAAIATVLAYFYLLIRLISRTKYFNRLIKFRMLDSKKIGKLLLVFLFINIVGFNIPFNIIFKSFIYLFIFIIYSFYIELISKKEIAIINNLK